MAKQFTPEEALLRLTRNYASLCLPRQVPVLGTPPTALEFLREYVALNMPVVIRGAFSHWPALSKWTDDYLCEHLGEKEISVEVTPSERAIVVIASVESRSVCSCPATYKRISFCPQTCAFSFLQSAIHLLDGRADAVTEVEGHAKPLFMLPDTQRMTFADFLRKSRAPTGPVHYISHQNNSLREKDEFAALLSEDLEHEIGFATEAFGCPPEAVNFWCVCACMCVCVRVCMCACVRACV
jgi:peptidyl-lysine (3S)-dioxygenase / protease